MRGTAASTVALLVLLAAAWPQAQGTPPPTPLTMIARDGRRPVPTTIAGGQELVALDDVATLFRVTLREDNLAGAITLTYNGRSVIASADQAMASVSGRVITLPSPVVRSGRRWLVPVEFLSRALAPIYDQRIELRRAARLVIVGDLRVPRVTARIDAPGPPTRATVEISPAAPVTPTIESGRVVLRVDADALDLSLPAGAGLIDQIRAGDQPNSIAITVPASATARATVATADNVARVTVEVLPAGGSAGPPGITPATPPNDTGAAAGRPGGAPGEPGAGTNPTARANVPTIVIDPGHGGEDIGARGKGGLEEKAFTLDVARRLRAAIEMRLGIRVVLTRDEDRSLSLDERAAIANNSKASLFLSLHANASLSPAVAGAEVYRLRVDRDVEAARQQSAAAAVTMPVLGGGTRRIDVIRWDLAQARHIEQSATLAAMLRDDLAGHGVPLAARPEREAPLRVLEAADMPAALIEIAYLTNASQEALAASDAFKNSVVQSLLDSIVRFRGQPDVAP